MTALILAAALAATAAAPSPADRANIALGMQIAARIGDRLWPGWGRVPFVIDLQTANGAVMVNATEPSPAPSFAPDFEATFPLANGVPTIVIGEPQFTAAKDPIRWSVTLLHEHFHQWQDSWPSYVRATTGLGLAPPGDTNAMWMLNYPFPYTGSAPQRAYRTLTARLVDAVDAIGTARLHRAVAAYRSARAAFRRSLTARDYRYFAFQCWQEGTARYTEIAVARLAARTHAQDRTFLTDAQAVALQQDADGTFGRVIERLKTKGLADDERVNFYAVGAAEALLLDAVNPGWHAGYLDPRMDLGVYFP